jgi:hypothetical protein
MVGPKTPPILFNTPTPSITIFVSPCNTNIKAKKYFRVREGGGSIIEFGADFKENARGVALVSHRASDWAYSGGVGFILLFFLRVPSTAEMGKTPRTV